MELASLILDDFLFLTPDSESIARRSTVKSSSLQNFLLFFSSKFFVSMHEMVVSYLRGATEMSLTARNSPQLFRCSFSRRKKFQTNRLHKKFVRKEF